MSDFDDTEYDNLSLSLTSEPPTPPSEGSLELEHEEPERLNEPEEEPVGPDIGQVGEEVQEEEEQPPVIRQPSRSIEVTLPRRPSSGSSAGTAQVTIAASPRIIVQQSSREDR